MKRRVNLITLALFFSFLLTGFSQKSVAQDVELEIILPYSGNWNDWHITFYGYNGDVYDFYTDDDDWPIGVLGTIPAGTYNIDIQSPHFPRGFDIGVCGPNYYHFKSRNDGFTWYGAVIEPGTNIQIDEGY